MPQRTHHSDSLVQVSYIMIIILRYYYTEVSQGRLKEPTIRTALSRSQSLKMTSGDLPPNSSETFFRLALAQLKTSMWGLLL